MIKQALQGNFLYLAILIIAVFIFSSLGLHRIAFGCFIGLFVIGLKMIIEWLIAIIKNKM